MKSFSTQIAVASLVVAFASGQGGTLSYKAIPANQSDAGCGVTEDNFYTSAVDGGNTTGSDRTIKGISFDALIGAGATVTANDCTVNALSGKLSNATVRTKSVRADGGMKEMMSDMITVEGAGDNSEQEIVLNTANLEKGATYDLRIYICNSAGQNRQVNLAFVGDDQDPVETGFFNEDDATTSKGGFSDRNQVYYINFRYTWDGDTNPGVTITQKSGAAPFCLYALTNQTVEGQEATANTGQNPSFALVDMNSVFKQYRKTKDSEDEINSYKAAAKKEYDNRASDYKDELAKLNSLSGSERDKALTKVKDMEREINEFRVSREKDLQERALKLRDKIVGEITASIKELAGNTANVILDSSGMSTNGVPFVIPHAADADITTQLVAALNDKQSPEITPLEGLKIGMLSMNDVFKRYDKTKDSESEINASKAVAKKEYDKRADEYKKELAEVNSLSGEKRENQTAKVKEMEKSINDWRTTREKELQDQALGMRTKIVAEITSAIDAAVSKEEPTLIFDSSGMSLNGSPVLLTTANIPDVSDQIVSALNQGGKKRRKAELASSADLRFACIDLGRVFSASPGTKKAEDEMKRLREEAKEDLTSSDTKKREAKENELKEIARKKREPLVQKITATVRTLADNDGFNVVFDSSGNSLNGVSVVILTHDLPDLTDDVIANLR